MQDNQIPDISKFQGTFYKSPSILQQNIPVYPQQSFNERPSIPVYPQQSRPSSLVSNSSMISNEAVPIQPLGTFAPGTELAVNGYKVVIERFLAEGTLQI